MKKEKIYTYYGTNGSVTTSIRLPQVTSYTAAYQLIADKGKNLTKDGINFFVIKRVPLDEIDEWYEVNIEF
jgi:hypothetical protein